ncbi:MAG: hypothetical protein ABL903_18140 [Methylococcales bacterium]
MADIRPTKQWIGGGIRVDAQGHAWKHAVIPPHSLMGALCASLWAGWMPDGQKLFSFAKSLYTLTLPE